MPTSYQPGIPTGLVPLLSDYLNIQGNFGQLDTTFGVDHVKYSVSQNNAYHKAVHLVAQSKPSAVSGIGEFYCTTVNDALFGNDTTFYFQTSGARVMQMTRNVVPTAADPTFVTFLPGGLIIQGSRISNPPSPGSVTFPQPLTSSAFTLLITLTVSTVSVDSIVTITPNTASKTGFSYLLGVVFPSSLSWIAIGK